MPFTRTDIRRSEDGNAPRTLLELNALVAIGAILDKPCWWRDWTTQPAVRARWLAEIDEALVQRSVAQVLAVWPARRAIRQHLAPLLDAAALPNGDSKSSAVAALLAHARYPVADDLDSIGFGEGKPGKGDAQEDDSEDEDEDGDEEYIDYGEQDDGDDDDDVWLDAAGNEVSMEVAMDEAKKATGIIACESVDDIEEGEEQEDVAMEVDSEGDDEESKEFGISLGRHRHRNPFAQIAWYITMVLVQETLGDIPASQWTRTNIETSLQFTMEPNNPVVIGRTTKFLLAMLRSHDGSDDGRSAPRLETVQQQTGATVREDVARLLWYHCANALECVEASKKDICTVIDLVVQQLGLSAQEPIADESSSDKPIFTPGPVLQTWVCQSLISAEMKSKFSREVKALEAVQASESARKQSGADGDPLVDILDPLMYCLQLGETKRLPLSAAKKTYETAAEQMSAIMALTPKTKIPRGLGGFQYQAIPADVDVEMDEEEPHDLTVKFLSYINNLHPETYASMYDSLSVIFARFVPLFELVLSTLDTEGPMYETKFLASRDMQALYHAGGANILCPPSLVPPGLFEVEKPVFALRDTRCQVIVKITTVHLNKLNPMYPGSEWRTDGTPDEHVIATGIYCFECENVTPARLSFRTFVKKSTSDEDGESEDDELTIGLQYGVLNQQWTQQLGAVTARDDGCLVFPNIYQHKLLPFELDDLSQPGSLKILSFILINPTTTITSTATIPPQQEEWKAHGQTRKRRAAAKTSEPYPSSEFRKTFGIDEALMMRAEALRERASAARDGNENDDGQQQLALLTLTE